MRGLNLAAVAVIWINRVATVWTLLALWADKPLKMRNGFADSDFFLLANISPRQHRAFYGNHLPVPVGHFNPEPLRFEFGSVFCHLDTRGGFPHA